MLAWISPLLVNSRPSHYIFCCIIECPREFCHKQLPSLAVIVSYCCLAPSGIIPIMFTSYWKNHYEHVFFIIYFMIFILLLLVVEEECVCVCEFMHEFRCHSVHERVIKAQVGFGYLLPSRVWTLCTFLAGSAFVCLTILPFKKCTFSSPQSWRAIFN